VKLETFR